MRIKIKYREPSGIQLFMPSHYAKSGWLISQPWRRILLIGWLIDWFWHDFMCACEFNNCSTGAYRRKGQGALFYMTVFPVHRYTDIPVYRHIDKLLKQRQNKIIYIFFTILKVWIYGITLKKTIWNTDIQVYIHLITKNK